jgi:hypothetical protein
MIDCIKTKYLAATATKPARIRAWRYGDSVTITYNTALDSYGNAEYVARMLASRITTRGRWVAGYDDQDGYVFVMVSDKDPRDFYTD